MQKIDQKPFYAQFLAATSKEEAKQKSGGATTKQGPGKDEPIFTTLKAGKCGNDCDSDVDTYQR